MARITIYLPDDIARRLRRTAEANCMSVSGWIADQLSRDLEDQWPPSVLKAAGAIPDFPSIQEIRAGYGQDARRTYLKSRVL